MAGIAWRCALLVLMVGAGGAGCTPGSSVGPAARRGAIYGGSLDSDDLAVMALADMVDATHARGCSGTTIASRGTDGFLLTAAHCVVERDAANNPTLPLSVLPPSRLRVIPAADWAAAFNTQFHPVAAAFAHPGYAPSTGANDVAVVRYTGATAATPTIPILEPAADMLRGGSPITLVGYGATEADPQATQRRKIDRVINTVGTAGFDYSQTDGKGSCFGDSGGPALFDSSAGLTVAGVMVLTVEGCQTLGTSLRVSAASQFIHGVIDPAPVPDGGPDGGATDASAPADAQTTTDAPASTDVRDAGAPDGPRDASTPDGPRDAHVDAGGDGRPEPSSAAGGCGCKLAAESSPGEVHALLLAIAAAIAARRRRGRDGV